MKSRDLSMPLDRRMPGYTAVVGLISRGCFDSMRGRPKVETATEHSNLLAKWWECTLLQCSAHASWSLEAILWRGPCPSSGDAYICSRLVPWLHVQLGVQTTSQQAHASKRTTQLSPCTTTAARIKPWPQCMLSAQVVGRKALALVPGAGERVTRAHWPGGGEAFHQARQA